MPPASPYAARAGAFSAEFEIGDPRGERWERIEALADTGASFTWVPADVLRRLGVRPEFREQFRTADGRLIERDMAETEARWDGRRVRTLVVFGDEASPALLGAYTMEGWRVAADPVKGELVPVPGLAMGFH